VGFGLWHLGAVKPEDRKQWLKGRLGQHSHEWLAKNTSLRYGSALSLALSGSRDLKVQEAHEIANLLRIPMREVMAAFDMPAANEHDMLAPVAGYVGAADQVVLYDDGQSDNALDPYLLPFVLTDPDVTILKISGHSAAPRYLPGEHVAIGRREKPSRKMVGQEVVAATREGQIVLKRLQPGSRPTVFTLTSLDPTAAVIIDAELKWVAPILFHLPK
jgi:phage repressor protein C with HTH and peptisase S24 domain